MTTKMHEQPTPHGGGFLLGLVTGSAIGAGVVLYCAPRLVSELRRRFGKQAIPIRNSVSAGLQDVAIRVAGVAGRAADLADDVTRRGQAVRDDVVDAVARGAREVGRRAREVEQFATASKTGH